MSESHGRALSRALPPSTRNSIVSRTQLLNRLNSAHHTVVRAEGGAGKTSLVASWFEQAAGDDVSQLWLSVDESIRSRASFLHAVVQAVSAQVEQREGSPLHTYLAGAAGPSHVPALLVEELALASTRARLVIDDLHLLDRSAQEDLVWVLDHAPGLQLVVTTRVPTLLEEPVTAARLGVSVIDSDDMAFTRSELSELAHGLSHGFTDREVRELHEVTHGNVLAARIALSALGASRSRPTTVAARRRLVNELGAIAAQNLMPVFHDQNELEAALRIALIPEVDVALARELTGDPNVENTLARFLRDGVGVSRGSVRHPVFSFHALVAKALVERATEVLPPDAVHTARLTAVRHLAAHGDPVDVIRLLVDANEDDRVWPYFARQYSELSIHRGEEVIRILEALPDERFTRSGTLAIVLAIMLSERETKLSDRLLHLVRIGLARIAEAKADTGSPGRLLLDVARFAGLRAARRYVEASDAGAQLIEQLSTLPASVRRDAESMTNAALVQIVIVDELSGRMRTALAHSDRLVNDAHPGRVQHAMALRAGAQAVLGLMHDSRRSIDSMGESGTEAWRTSIPSAGWHVARAVQALETGDGVAAVEECRRTESDLPLSEHWPTMLWARGLARLVDGHAALGADELAIGIDRHRGRTLSARSASRLTAIRADLAIASGAFATALRHIEAGPAGPELELTRARFELSRQQPEKAVQTLGAIEQSVGAEPRLYSELLVLSAAAHSRLHHDVDAREQFERALAIMHENGLASPLSKIARFEVVALLAAVGAPEDLAPRRDPFAATSPGEYLSDRERVVLSHLAGGDSIPDIAGRLYVSVNTVKTQVKSIYRKLEVSSREDAVRAGRRRGLLDDCLHR